MSSGKLQLTDLEGNLLNVPRQCVSNCPVETIGEDVIPVIIAAVAMAIVLFILFFIICAVCAKKKATDKKPFTVSAVLSPNLPTYLPQPQSQTPTYRSFQFADSMDGTNASLARSVIPNNYVNKLGDKAFV